MMRVFLCEDGGGLEVVRATIAALKDTGVHLVAESRDEACASPPLPLPICTRYISQKQASVIQEKRVRNFDPRKGKF